MADTNDTILLKLGLDSDRAEKSLIKFGYEATRIISNLKKAQESGDKDAIKAATAEYKEMLKAVSSVNKESIDLRKVGQKGSKELTEAGVLGAKSFDMLSTAIWDAHLSLTQFEIDLDKTGHQIRTSIEDFQNVFPNIGTNRFIGEDVARIYAMSKSKPSSQGWLTEEKDDAWRQAREIASHYADVMRETGGIIDKTTENYKNLQEVVRSYYGVTDKAAKSEQDLAYYLITNQANLTNLYRAYILSKEGLAYLTVAMKSANYELKQEELQAKKAAQAEKERATAIRKSEREKADAIRKAALAEKERAAAIRKSGIEARRLALFQSKSNSASVAAASSARSYGSSLSKISSEAGIADIAIDKLKSGMNKFSGSIKRLVRNLLSIAGFGTLVQSLKTLAEAYNSFESQETKLQALMKARMAATNEEIKSIEDLIEAQAKQGVMSRKLQTTGAQQLATYVTQKDSLEKLIPAMNNVTAQLYGINATESNIMQTAKLFGKIMNGQTETLKRQGYTVTAAEESMIKYGTETEKVNAIVNIMNRRCTNMNEILANTDGGKQKQLANTFEDVKIELGEALSTIKTVLIPVMASAVRLLSMFATELQRFANTIRAVFGSGKSSIAVGTDEVEDYTDALEAAAEAAEKLGKYDKLNVIDDDKDEEDTSVGITAAAIDVSDNVGKIEVLSNALSSLLENIRKIAEYVSKTFGPIISSVATIFEKLNGKLMNFANKVWRDVVKPSLEEFSDTFTEVMDSISEFWERDGGPLVDSILTAIDDIDAGINDFWDTTFKPIYDELTGDLSGFYEIYCNPLVQDILGALSEIAIAYATTVSLLGRGVSVISGWIGKGSLWYASFKLMAQTARTYLGDILIAVDKLVAGFRYLVATANALAQGDWKKAWDMFKLYAKSGLEFLDATVGKMGRILLAFGDIILPYFTEDIRRAFADIKGIIGGIIGFIGYAANGDWKKAWESMKDVFLKVWDLISISIKSPINLIIDVLNNFINSIDVALATIVKGLNSINIKIPSWVPGVGGNSFGINIQTPYIPRIPKLATGAVLPANKPFLSVVGDQRHGTNIETPLDTMIQAFNTALDSRNTEGDIYLKMDGDVMMRWIRKKNKEYNNRYGLV